MNLEGWTDFGWMRVRAEGRVELAAEAKKVGRWPCLGCVLEWLSMTGSWGDRQGQREGIWDLTFFDPSSLEAPTSCLEPCEGHAYGNLVSSHSNPVNLGLWKESL